MPRKAAVWTRKDRPGWWATIDGKQVNLGDDYKDAQKELYRRKASSRPAVGRSQSVAVLVDMMLEAVHSDVQASTFANYRWYLQQWVNFAGHRPASGVKPLDAAAWFRSRPGWNASTRRLATEMVRRWSRWCRKHKDTLTQIH